MEIWKWSKPFREQSIKYSENEKNAGDFFRVKFLYVIALKNAITQGIKVDSNFRCLYVILWVQGVACKRANLLCGSVCDAWNEASRSNSESNAWKTGLWQSLFLKMKNRWRFFLLVIFTYNSTSAIKLLLPLAFRAPIYKKIWQH